jgi:hypothetical protein
MTWRRIPSLERYEINKSGRVRNWVTKCVIAQVPHTSSGYHRKGAVEGAPCYQRVMLYTAAGRRWYRVHVLVARTFIGPCPYGHNVDHINRNPSDNRARNLRYLPTHLNHSR